MVILLPALIICRGGFRHHTQSVHRAIMNVPFAPTGFPTAQPISIVECALSTNQPVSQDVQNDPSSLIAFGDIRTDKFYMITDTRIASRVNSKPLDVSYGVTAFH